MQFPDPQGLIEAHDIGMVGYQGMDGSLVMDASRFTYQPMDFHVRPGFPMIAKLALGAVVMGFAGLFGLARPILRRVMKASDAKVV